MDLVSKLKREVRFIRRFSHLGRPLSIEKKWYGNQYGGFYLIPHLLRADSLVYSFGVGQDVSFDLDLIKRHGASVVGFDPTPKSIAWVKEQSLPPEYSFLPVGLAKESGRVTFHLPKDSNHVSGSLVAHSNVSETDAVEVEMKSFADLVKELQPTGIDVLKMDIEGSEYDVLESVLDSDVPIKQLAIEIHERFYPDGKKRSRQMIDLLDKHGYVLFGLSESFEELSFVKKNLL